VFKRVVWFGLGAAAGASGVVWAEQQVRRRLDDLGPDHVVQVAGRSARRLGRSVLDAVAEGRSTMLDTEDELRARRDRRLAEGRPAEGREGRGR
jgi:hypothetical protein